MEEIIKIGYVRVSKQEQHEACQIDALKEAGCEKWFVDKITGSKAEKSSTKQWPVQISVAYLNRKVKGIDLLFSGEYFRHTESRQQAMPVQ